MTTQTAHPSGPTTSARWVPVALFILILVPAIAGALRLLELFGGPQLLLENPRMAAVPAPVILHIIGAITYLFLGAFQFSGRVRRRWPRWHRRTGRVLVVLGLVVAFSAMWMTQFYPRQPGTGELAYIFRLAFGSGMAACIILGLVAIRRAEIGHHRVWMIRAYALALGSGTQVFTEGIGEAALGPSELTTDLMLGAGWVLNLVAAEYIIRSAGIRNGKQAGKAGLP